MAQETYQTLFSKYRPRRFEDAYQRHVTKVLKAEVIKGEVPPVFMIQGPSGTGKTSLARIMVMALLCQNRPPDDPEPCGECQSCQLVINDTHRDYIEINCATNGGVDHVREQIAEKLRIAPSIGRFRFFLLDECHLLSNSAQSALLKIIEEPPPYVRFFLCSTDPHKIIHTIHSRCEGHVLHKLSNMDMLDLLTKVVQAEEMVAEEAALDLIVQEAAGGARKALAILGQVRLIGVTEENIRETLGRGPRGLSLDLLRVIRDCNRGEMLRLIDAAQKEGRALGVILDEAARSLMMIARYNLLKINEDERDPLLADLTGGFTRVQLTTVVSDLTKITRDIRQNVAAELVVQVGLLELIDRLAAGKVATKK